MEIEEADERQPVSWLEWVLLALIVLVAAVLRMGWPGLTEFKADEARLWALALDMAEGQFALRGISSSTGFPNFPASVWVYAISAVIGASPIVGTVWTGLLSSSAVVACAWFVRRYWGTAAALTATALYAASPWAVIFSRKIWAQNLLPIFVMAWVISAALAFVEGRKRWLWLHLVALALAVQIHLAAMALIPITLVLLILFRKRTDWRTLLIGAALAALTVLPFALYLGGEMQAGGLPSLTSGDDGETTVLALDSLRFIGMLATGSGSHSLAGADAFEDYLARVPAQPLAQGVVGLLVLIGLVVAVVECVRQWPRPRSQVTLIVLLWLLVPGLFFVVQWTPIFIHYFIAVLPAPFVLVGVMAAALWRHSAERGRRWSRWLFGTLVAALTVFQALAVLLLIFFVADTHTPGGFGTPLKHELDAVAQAKVLMAETNSAEILIAASGESPRIDDAPAVYDVLLRDVSHRFVDVDRHALFPADNVVVLVDGREPSPTWTGDLYAEAASQTVSVALRPDEGELWIHALPGDSKPAPDRPIEPSELLANWVTLVGVDEPDRVSAEEVIWQLHWISAENPDSSSYQFFTHVVAADGSRVGQSDGPAFNPAAWQAGDELISRFMVPWPAEGVSPVTVRVGMYRYPSLENVPLLDVAANPKADALDIPFTE